LVVINDPDPALVPELPVPLPAFTGALVLISDPGAGPDDAGAVVPLPPALTGALVLTNDPDPDDAGAVVPLPPAFTGALVLINDPPWFGADAVVPDVVVSDVVVPDGVVPEGVVPRGPPLGAGVAAAVPEGRGPALADRYGP